MIVSTKAVCDLCQAPSETPNAHEEMKYVDVQYDGEPVTMILGVRMPSVGLLDVCPKCRITLLTQALKALEAECLKA